MERHHGLWSAPSLTRHKTAIIALTAVALGCSLYYAHDQYTSTSDTNSSTPSALRRSNAQRRRQRHEVQESARPNQQLLLETLAGDPGLNPEDVESQETIMEVETGHSSLFEDDSVDPNENEHGQEGRSLLSLVYRIGEEEAKTNGYVHRRVTCNSCDATPISGIRYHCANCPDYDLCEQCEAMQIHPKTHIFYKIRIPAPWIHNPKREPVWYPGRPRPVNDCLSKERTMELCKQSGFQKAEVDAMWEQFRCLAATEWPDDHEPGDYHLGIDRRTFDECFIPHTSHRPPAQNLIFDRMFSFYDQNEDGLIDIEEFVTGLASLRRKNVDVRQRRVFKAYDADNDGFVDRKDFLRMFGANFALTKELTRDVVTSMEDPGQERNARDIILGNRPLSAAFVDPIPPGEPSRAGEGKVQDRFGDYQIVDGTGPIDENDYRHPDPNDVIMDAIEMKYYGNLRSADARQMHCHRIYSDPWPPEDVAMEDVWEVMGSAVSPGDVTLLEDQNAIRRATHGRMARQHQQRSFEWRMAIRERKMKHSFYLDGELSDPASQTSEATADQGSAQLNKTFGKDLKRLEAAGRAGPFHGVVGLFIEDLEWPVRDLESMVGGIRDMIWLDWTGLAIAEDLSGYTGEFSESKALTVSILQCLEHLVEELGPRVPEKEPVQGLSPPRRLRSSSKVRFEDDLSLKGDHEDRSRATSETSHSVSMDKRLRDNDETEPESDVGREVLYQVTQEAFNELLDPIFRLREDLGFAVLRYGSVLERFRAKAAGAVSAPVDLKLDLDLYQKRWLRHEGPVYRDEAEPLHDFLVQRAGSLSSSLTAEKCSHCASYGHEDWIPLGGLCSTCSKPSSTMLGDFGTLSASLASVQHEICPRCAEKGQESTILGPVGQTHCINCGQPHTRFAENSARLREIIAGSGKHESPLTVGENGTAEEGASAQPETLPPLPTPLVLDLTQLQNMPSSINSPDNAKTKGETGINEPSPDPTLPQNRPNGTSQNDQTSSDPPELHQSEHRLVIPLKWYAALCLIEHEDKERGGPGRLNYQEFDELMKGEKGRSLGFLESWIDMVSF